MRCQPASPPTPPADHPRRLIFVSNHLPLKVSKGETGWNFEWDEDALIAQAKEGLPEDMEALYVGCLPVEVDVHEQEVRCGGSGAATGFVGCGVWEGNAVAAAARWSGVHNRAWRGGAGRAAPLQPLASR